MAMYLKDILKQANDKLKGVRNSTTEPAATGKDPGVDYKPKSGDEADFIAKHSVQKWDEPYGNPNYADKVGYTIPKEKNHGNTEAKAKATNEEVQIDERNAENKMKKDAAATAMGSKNRDDKHLGSRGMKTSVADKIRGREKMSGKDRQQHEETINELSPATKKAYVAAATDDKKEAERQANHSEYTAKHAKTAKQKSDFSNEAKWLKGIAAKRAKGIAMATKEETDPGFAESKKAEDTKCNMSEAGTWCPMHEMANCSSARPIKELSTDLLHRAAHKAAKVAMTDVQGRSGPIFKKRAAQANKFRAKGMEQEKKEKAAKAVKEEAIDEKHLTPAEMKKREEVAQAIHRENPKMPMGKKMAIATSTAKKVAEDLAVPLLGSHEPPRGQSDEAAEMVKTELKALANKAMHLVTQMPDNMHVEPWVQAKIATAKELVSGVHDYMVYGDHDKPEEDEQMDSPMTFPSMNVDAARI